VINEVIASPPIASTPHQRNRTPRRGEAVIGLDALAVHELDVADVETAELWHVAERRLNDSGQLPPKAVPRRMGEVKLTLRHVSSP
jgi:hypothetical protein